MVSAAYGPADRGGRVIALVGTGHFFSHFFHLCLPPLFPLLKPAFGVGYAELGLLLTGLYVATGLAQTPAGFLVDRWGADRVLAGGLALLSLAVALIGVVPGFWWILPLTVLAGIGNSVFHPADYAILSAAVPSRRMATAYAIHSAAGNLGWAAAPVTMLALAALLGWRGAFILAGLAGLGVALALFTQRAAFHLQAPAPLAPQRRGRMAANWRLLTGSAVVACLCYFALLSIGQTAFQTFLPPTLEALFGTTLTVANAALTGFLLAGAAGIMAGGILADRFARHELIVGAGLTLAALLALLIGSRAWSDPALIALVALTGGLVGATMPSRDMLVRAAAPPGASGRVFGFVYSGLDLGGALAPLVVGLILDAAAPGRVFTFIAAAWALTILAAIRVRRQAAAPLAP